MILSKWLQFIKPNLKFYKDGFFEFPFLANTPELMIEATIKTPGSKHFPEEQLVHRNNPFIKGTFRYRKIDEGCWLTITNIEFKQNALIRTVYDKHIPSEHYTLTFTMYESQVKLQNKFINDVPFQNKFWGFKKPGTDTGAHFYKGSKCEFYIYHFYPDWINKNLPFDKLDKDLPFKRFLDSDKGFITYQDIVPNAASLSHEIEQTFKTFNDNVFSDTLLKAQTLSLVSTFFKNAFADLRKEDYKVKDAIDYKKMSQCERLISKDFAIPFIGIEAIAKKLNLSPSKLKMDFKLVYGTSILQYNIDKKMQLAMELVQNTDMQIKHVALEVGYENHSKFSAVFKKKFGKLPSEIYIERNLN
ncbi:helix-turn-helix domain-containing protein [Flavobacterium hiemivividum]|uniref:AraC family transcriptional regulator n=1 Tax=Flavobacterium hiemivividum TaxID=2541734 RepID=A0A4R5CMK3_9FLAO|nr:AraC family transcriptional regulator [Flavobacterium hiemivividum]TDE01599.1 AraC family transcriptional regulator [Flavobacterium hiemivividum]